MSILTTGCIICSESLDNGEIRVVKKRGISTLKDSSVKRKNTELAIFLENVEEVTVHRACQQTYNDERRILASVHREKPASNLNQNITRSKLPSFDFKNNCCFCGESITDEFLEKQKKKTLSRRNVICKVEKIDTAQSILNASNKRNDEWSAQIKSRIQELMCNETDLVAVDARYHLTCQQRFYSPTTTGAKRGYRPATNVDEAMEKIYAYLADNSEECQFSLESLIEQIDGDYTPDIRTIKSRLKEKYGEDIVIANSPNDGCIVCFRNTGSKILNDVWYHDRETNLVDERLRIVKTAGNIILEDIRSLVLNSSEYPPTENFLSDINSVLPESLLTLLQTVILTNKKGSLDSWKKKCVALGHAIVAAVRPKSFISSLLTGVSVFIYKKIGSKKLLDLLSTLGFASSYYETARLEASYILAGDEKKIESGHGAFGQFVFDNADFNVNTLDGLGTFHAMGGIMAATPSDGVRSGTEVISRITNCSATDIISKTGSIQLKNYRRPNKEGLKSICVTDIDFQNSNEILPSAFDVTWIYGKWAQIDSVPSWHGYMEKATSGCSYETSKVICLPFINAPPNDSDTVFTSLLEAKEKCDSLQFKSCIVTFDQPLYWKARDMAMNKQVPELSNVIVRLGGFHLLMSFMGSVGTIMAGSGLKDLFCVIYAENSVEKMLYGHAYARAVRAHILVHTALSCLVFDQLQFTEQEKFEMENILSDDSETSKLYAHENSIIHSIRIKLKSMLCTIENDGPTSKLWIQYFRMITLLKNFIQAERTGDWQLHLETTKEMLPYFHAAGHFNYAKCVHLYYQDMISLESKMDPQDFHKFTVKGYFTIRRSDKFWSGIWSDMTIEQTLMRSMKCSGGLTHGRGITESVLSRWILGMVHLLSICEQVDKFAELTATTSEQHVDLRPTRIMRDNQDIKKLISWLNVHPPFIKTDVIMSISTNVVGESEVNCHVARETGIKSLKNIVENNFADVKIQRKNKVLTLAAFSNNFKILGDEKIIIDPLTLFQRACIFKHNDEDLKEYLKFELAPFPMSLFSEGGMRKGTKSTLYSSFDPVHNNIDIGNKKCTIIDGGHLLHKVVWNNSSLVNFKTICERYTDYVLKHFGLSVVVVFDGYPDDSTSLSTKSWERSRRSSIHSSSKILFDRTTSVTMTQSKFLSNNSNKSRLIQMLTEDMHEKGFEVLQAIEDADVLIINTAISKATEYDTVVIIGDDIDLLVLLTALASPYNNIYLQKPEKNGCYLYSSHSFKYYAREILFLHAFSGCDTTSAPYGQGKTKFCNIFQKQPNLNKLVSVFRNPNATAEEIGKAGEKFLVALYGGDTNDETLDDLRINLFQKYVTKSKIDLARLPPTRDAAWHHSLRTYHQVQAWMGKEKNPLEWGWRTNRQRLEPITTTKNAAPDALLKTIFCQCKKGCVKSCSCRKSGLTCSTACKNCCGQSCLNVPKVNSNDDNSDEESISIINQMIAQETEDIRNFTFTVKSDESYVTNRKKKSKI